MTLLFGWCMTGEAHHEACREAFESDGKTITCACECHKTKEKVSE
jgi:hypothetical protein